MFEVEKPRQFHYVPRFYDPEKEKWEALKKKYAAAQEKRDETPNADEQTNGEGDADLDVKCKNINVTTRGAGEVELEGECESLTKHSSGMASIDSRNLTIHEVVKIQ